MRRLATEERIARIEALLNAATDMAEAAAANPRYALQVDALRVLVASRGSNPRGRVMTGAPDPIFAVIEAHKAALFKQMQANRNHADLGYGVEYEQALEKTRARHREMDEIAQGFATVRPTTMAGVIALLIYICDVDSGAFKIAEDFRSCHFDLPQSGGADGPPFESLVMRNALAALEAMGGCNAPSKH